MVSRGLIKIKAEIYLLGIVVIWGSTFAVVKEVLEQITPFTFLAYRFLVAVLVLGLIFGRKIKSLNQITLKKGSLIGIFLFLSYAFQTVGLKYTTATKAGFITGLSVVLVPPLAHFFTQEKISRNSTVGVVLAVIGLGFLNYNYDYFNFNRGDFLVLLGALSFALHLITVDRYTKKLDYVLLVIVQLATVWILSSLLALFWEKPGLSLEGYSIQVWWSIIWTGVLATALAFYLQNRFQRYSTATRTAIIFSGEPFFGAIFAHLLLGEEVGLLAGVGGLMIILGMIISQKENR